MSDDPEWATDYAVKARRAVLDALVTLVSPRDAETLSIQHALLVGVLSRLAGGLIGAMHPAVRSAALELATAALHAGLTEDAENLRSH